MNWYQSTGYEYPSYSTNSLFDRKAKSVFQPQKLPRKKQKQSRKSRPHQKHQKSPTLFSRQTLVKPKAKVPLKKVEKPHRSRFNIAVFTAKSPRVPGYNKQRFLALPEKKVPLMAERTENNQLPQVQLQEKKRLPLPEAIVYYGVANNFNNDSKVTPRYVSEAEMRESMKKSKGPFQPQTEQPTENVKLNDTRTEQEGIYTDYAPLSLPSPDSLRKIAIEYVFNNGQQNRTVETLSDDFYSASIVKDNKKYICRGVFGKATLLTDPDSEAVLKIPENLYGVVFGHIHTSFTQFIDSVPIKECFVSPVPDYTFKCIDHALIEQPIYTATAPLFHITLPHRIKDPKLLKSVKVRHGDIHKNLPFRQMSRTKQNKPENNSKLPSSFFMTTSKTVEIFTRSFSQFVCTSCKKTCSGNLTALIYDKLFPCDGQMVGSLRIRLGSNLLSIKDLRKDLNDIEGSLGFTPNREFDLDLKSTLHPKHILEISLQAYFPWKPLERMKHNETWNPETRKLIQRKTVDTMSGLAGHCCKTEPSVVCHFDLRSDDDNNNNNNDLDDAFPSTTTELGFMIITHQQPESRPRGIFHKLQPREKGDYPVESFPVFVTRKTQAQVESMSLAKNDAERYMMNLVEWYITDDTILQGVAVNLGIPNHKVEQIRTDHSGSIAQRAWNLVFMFYRSSQGTKQEKVDTIRKAVVNLGFGHAPKFVPGYGAC